MHTCCAPVPRLFPFGRPLRNFNFEFVQLNEYIDYYHRYISALLEFLKLGSVAEGLGLNTRTTNATTWRNQLRMSKVNPILGQVAKSSYYSRFHYCKKSGAGVYEGSWTLSKQKV